jgi:hypothetical protein
MPISRVAAASRVSSSNAAKAVKLNQVKNSDTGLKVKSTATSLTVSGFAKGTISVNPETGKATGSAYERTEELPANLSFGFDQDRMPNFDTSSGYTAKNAWYFAHSVEVPVKKGQTPEQVLRALAAKVNEKSGYQASVVANADGSATLNVARK